MPSFAGASRDRSVAVDAADVVRLDMDAPGFSVQPLDAGTWGPVWFARVDEHFSTVRLDASVIDGAPADQVEVELWAQEQEVASGVFLGRWTWTVDPVKPSRPSIVAAVAGPPARAWGVRGRMVSPTTRRLAFGLVLDRCPRGTGLLWLGEGVTVVP